MSELPDKMRSYLWEERAKMFTRKDVLEFLHVSTLADRRKHLQRIVEKRNKEILHQVSTQARFQTRNPETRADSREREIRQLLGKLPLVVLFRRKDGGNLRQMTCTTNEKFIPVPQRAELLAARPGQITVFDLTKKAWRSFRMDLLLDVALDDGVGGGLAGALTRLIVNDSDGAYLPPKEDIDEWIFPHFDASSVYCRRAVARPSREYKTVLLASAYPKLSGASVAELCGLDRGNENELLRDLSAHFGCQADDLRHVRKDLCTRVSVLNRAINMERIRFTLAFDKTGGLGAMSYSERDMSSESESDEDLSHQFGIIGLVRPGRSGRQRLKHPLQYSKAELVQMGWTGETYVSRSQKGRRAPYIEGFDTNSDISYDDLTDVPDHLLSRSWADDDHSDNDTSGTLGTDRENERGRRRRQRRKHPLQYSSSELEQMGWSGRTYVSHSQRGRRAPFVEGHDSHSDYSYDDLTGLPDHLLATSWVDSDDDLDDHHAATAARTEEEGEASLDEQPIRVASMDELQVALEHCPDGATILCAAGRYDGALELPRKALTLRGTARPCVGKHASERSGKRLEELTVFTSTLRTGAHARGQMLRLENLVGHEGLVVEENEYVEVHIRYCRFEMPLVHKDCVELRGSAKKTLLNHCSISGGKDCVMIDARNVEIRSCTIQRAGRRGIFAVRDFAIRDSVVKRCGDHGVRCCGGCDVKGECNIQFGPWNTCGTACGTTSPGLAPQSFVDSRA